MGYLPLKRAIRNHWTWKDKPFALGQAWIDLLLMANSKLKQVFFKEGAEVDKTIEVRPNGFLTVQATVSLRPRMVTTGRTIRLSCPVVRWRQIHDILENYEEPGQIYGLPPAHRRFLNDTVEQTCLEYWDKHKIELMLRNSFYMYEQSEMIRNMIMFGNSMYTPDRFQGLTPRYGGSS